MINRNKPSCFPHILGGLIVVASLGFVGVLLWSHRNTVLDFRPSVGGAFLLAAGAVSYAAAGLLLAMAWRILLGWAGETDVCRRESRKIYARTQIAKYVPGNVMQLVGRHLAGRQAGWSHVGLVLSSAFEMLMLLCIGLTMALVGLVVTGTDVGMIELPVLFALLLMIFAGSIFVVRLAPGLVITKWPEVSTRLSSRNLFGLWPVGLIYVGFFLIGGLVLLLICNVVLESPVRSGYWPAVLSLFAVAWTAGVVTPGAPSGLGVRETVLVVGLGPLASPAEAILVAGLLRLLTVGGDILFFITGASGLWFPLDRSARGGPQRRAD